MKLTAPPPPAEPDPVLPPSETEAASIAATDTPVPSEAPPPRMAVWPQWFTGVDLLLAALVIAVAFLAASFTARNTDVWLHLASGKRLTTGEYRLGSDPFSYTGADRTWVNHNWLFDLGAFLLYGGDGFVLVLVKAIVVAAAFGLVLAIRRTGQPLWPWTILTAFAVLASINQFSLRPIVGSIFFLAATLFAVFRMPSRPGSWRFPIVIGVLFALWSNFDGWFFVGPAVLALLTIGEAIRQRTRPLDSEAASTSLAALPDLQTLTRALVVGILACMVNPHHYRVWQLPFELVGGAGIAADQRLRYMLMSPLVKEFWNNSSLAFNINGIAYVLLLAAGVYAAFLAGAVGRLFGSSVEIEPLPLPHTILWCGAAALSLLSLYAIPFFAVITVPLAASRFNDLSGRIVLRSRAETRTRLLLSASVGFRLLSILGLIALGLAAWPGWLHPPASCWWESEPIHPANSRRVAWAVEADSELQRSAEWLHEARSSGRLPADLRGIQTSIDEANYCAWFAPEEKVFANSRFNHHRAEWSDLIELRRAMGLLSGKSEVAETRQVESLLDRWNIAYLSVACPPSELQTLLRVKLAIVGMMSEWPVWSTWYFNGRAGVFGFKRNPGLPAAVIDRLEVEPAQQAFGPKVVPLPEVKTEQPVLDKTAYDQFIRGPRTTPAGAEEALAWLDYKRQIAPRQTEKFKILRFMLTRLTPRLPVWPMPQDYIGMSIEKNVRNPGEPALAPWPKMGSIEACSILALRAARRAIAADPNHPDGYFALAQVFEDGGFPMAYVQRRMALVTAYRQCLSRMPEPAHFRTGIYLARPTEVALRLSELYLGKDTPLGRQFPPGEYPGLRVESPLAELCLAGGLYVVQPGPATGGRALIVNVPPIPQYIQSLPPNSTRLDDGLYVLPLDLARQVLLKGEEYARVEYTDPDIASKMFKYIDDHRKPLLKAWENARKQYRDRAERITKVREREATAVRSGLIGDALEMLKTADFTKDFEDAVTETALHQIALELAVGRLEDAASDIDDVRSVLDKQVGGANSQRLKISQRRLTELDYQKLLLEGNYAEAGRLYEQLYGESVGKFPPLADLTRPDMKGFDPLKLDQRPYQFFGAGAYPGVGWPAFALLVVPESPVVEIARLLSSYVQVNRYHVLYEVFTRMREDSDFFFNRGVLALLEGDIAGARQRFLSATRQPPDGWKLPPSRNLQAETYLRFIDDVRNHPGRSP